MLMGVSRYAASEFSFLLAVPMMMGATVLEVYKSIGFLNPERVSMPDFDIDFCYERRQEVIGTSLAIPSTVP